MHKDIEGKENTSNEASYNNNVIVSGNQTDCRTFLFCLHLQNEVSVHTQLGYMKHGSSYVLFGCTKTSGMSTHRVFSHVSETSCVSMPALYHCCELA